MKKRANMTAGFDTGNLSWASQPTFMAARFDWGLYTGNLPWLSQSTFLLTKHGSHAYGLNTEESDLDIKGICIAPIEYYLGFIKKFEQAEFGNGKKGREKIECTIYDIKKFFSLAANCNPNIIEVLFTDEEDWYCIETPLKWIRSSLLLNREKFLSKKAKHTFSGYAHAQLKRIETHRKWLLNPPTHDPTREEFNLPNTTLLSKDILGSIEALHNKEGEEFLKKEFSEEVLSVYFKERKYANAKREWAQFQNWQKTRNKERAGLEKQYGYDTKHASHLIRLYKMGKEILGGKGVIVKRKEDREELLEIKRGALSYQQLMDYAEKMDGELNILYETSKLPLSPDREKLDTVLVSMISSFR